MASFLLSTFGGIKLKKLQLLIPHYQEQQEEWRDIKGYEGLYQISSHGRVKSMPRKGSRGGIIKPSFSNSGYLQIHLCKNCEQKTIQIHRLVAIHFLDNPDNLPEVNHKDECKTNNHVSNLEFCTREYNENYGTKRARCVANHDYKKSAILSAMHHDYEAISRKRGKPILQMDLNGNIIKRWYGLNAACKALGFSSGNVSAACNGKYKTAYGYKWRYEGC